MRPAADLVADFPAKYSREILDDLGRLLEAEAERLGRPIRVLDQFAGTGLIHTLASPAVQTFGVELEPELAALHPRTEQGDALALRFEAGSFDAWCTSCAYGNRMADTYRGGGTCRACGGTGAVVFDSGPDACPKCDGTGEDWSKRMTYAVALGRDPSAGSTADKQWGPEYRTMHRIAWREALRVVRRAGLGIVNVKNHVRDRRLQDVVGWHRRTLEHLGAKLVEVRPVETPGYCYGANHEARDDAEMVIVVRVP